MAHQPFTLRDVIGLKIMEIGLRLMTPNGIYRLAQRIYERED